MERKGEVGRIFTINESEFSRRCDSTSQLDMKAEALCHLGPSRAVHQPERKDRKYIYAHICMCMRVYVCVREKVRDRE